MSPSASSASTEPLPDHDPSWDDLCRAADADGPTFVMLDGRGGFSETWLPGTLLAIRPELIAQSGGGGRAGVELRRLDDRVGDRRRQGGTSATGVAVLLAYELWGSDAGQTVLAAWEVDRAIRRGPSGRLTLAARDGDRGLEAEVERLRSAASGAARAAARASGRPRTSLPRDEYLQAVRRLLGHIGRGDIYQANLCQRFSVPYHGDELATYLALARDTPAPHSAFVRAPGWSVASVSPESFLRSRRPHAVETWPIKGTRPRGSGDEADDRAAAELRESAKDRAELMMIVDLERNDLGRICSVGTVGVDPLVELRSYAAVHHLVAGIHGELRRGVGLEEMLEATFPGGSITGAPKVRAMELLRQVEPVRRGFFTGSLFWLADDGTLDSSILIRTVVFEDGLARIGAGGGIVADSDPEQEWRESNHKARAPARALGFDPEEAS